MKTNLDKGSLWVGGTTELTMSGERLRVVNVKDGWVLVRVEDLDGNLRRVITISVDRLMKSWKPVRG